MSYKFFNITDSKKDAISVSSIPKSLEEAYTYFAGVKRMSVDTFKQLFKVEEI